MKKYKGHLICLVVSILYGGLAYLILNNIIIALVVFLSFSLATLFLILPMVEKKAAKNRKREECYHFVQTFIISLTVNASPEASYLSAIEGAEGELSSIYKSIGTDMGVDERLEYLSRYFIEPYYPVFLSIYQLYQEQGGDLLKLAEPLLNEVSRSEEDSISYQKESKRLLFDYLILWALSSAVLVFVKFGLKNFYDKMLESPIYVALSTVSFFIILTGFVIYAFAYTGEKPKFRRKNNDKKAYKEAE